jgi:hypothetical protein
MTLCYRRKPPKRVQGKQAGCWIGIQFTEGEKHL